MPSRREHGKKDHKSSRRHHSSDSSSDESRRRKSSSSSRSRSRSGDRRPRKEYDREKRDRRDSPPPRERDNFERKRFDDVPKRAFGGFDRDRDNGSFRSDFGKRDNMFGSGLPQGGRNASGQIAAPVNGASVPIKKNFFTEVLKPATRSTEEISEWRMKHKITVGIENTTGNSQGVPNPILSFSEVSLPSLVTSELMKAGFAAPTPIQSQGWPIALRGHDLVGIAKTGSGKTVAFIIPAFMHIMAQMRPKAGEGPIALVLAPTRELAVQINNECEKFGITSGFRTACVYGGAEKYKQKRILYRGVDIIIATPGRLIDLIEEGVTNLNRVSYLVLDEADRMLDMGFEDQIRSIVGRIRPDRQTLMWSATWPPEVRKLARELCNEDPIKIQVGSQDLAVNDMITQKIEVCNEDDKKNRCLDILKGYQKTDKILVFCATKRNCDGIARILDRSGYAANPIHGDKTQAERDRVMADFKSGRRPILVATDLAARGLDIKDIKLVLNYDFPGTIEDYIHRVGRTGRAGAAGVSISFFTSDNWKLGNELLNCLKETNQHIPAELHKYARGGGGRSHGYSSNRRDFGGRGGGRGGGNSRFRSDGPSGNSFGSRFSNPVSNSSNYSGQKSYGTTATTNATPYNPFAWYPMNQGYTAMGTMGAMPNMGAMGAMGGFIPPITLGTIAANPMMTQNAMTAEGSGSKKIEGDKGAQPGNPLTFAMMLQNYSQTMVNPGLQTANVMIPSASQLSSQQVGASQPHNSGDKKADGASRFSDPATQNNPQGFNPSSQNVQTPQIVNGQ